MTKPNLRPLPLLASERSDNAYILPCDIYQGRRHYAVCLRIVNRHEDGNPAPWEPNCNNAIACRQCPAVKMRDEEDEAGHALYYTPRELGTGSAKTKPIDIHSRSYQRGWGAVDRVNRNASKPQSVPTEPVKKAKKKGEFLDVSPEALVNKLSKKEQK